MSQHTDETPPTPARPRSLAPEQLGFTPKAPVPWLGPVLLAATGTRVVLAEQFGAYLDKRELQDTFPKRLADHSGQEQLWFDFVADVGDGFDATYSVAHLLAQSRLELDGTRLPRGQILVLGGDQVYPTASAVGYEDRFKGPYQAALPAVAPGQPAPVLFALPGNHDWYDGLTAFLRIFTRRPGASIGGWQTAQTRSYFAVKLPQRWWLLAIDAQQDAYLDDPQLTYFREVAASIEPGDRVILCTPQPGWVHGHEKAGIYETTDYFLRKVIGPTGAEVPLMLSGDLHHYSRYTGPGRQLVTFGGGGAYLYGTDKLPKKITVPPKGTIARAASHAQDYRLARTYPSRMRSRTLGAGVFLRLLTRNQGLLALLGVLQTLLLLALDNAGDRVLTVPVFIMVATMLGLTLFFAAGLTVGPTETRHYLLGLVHGLAQVGIGVAGLAWWHTLIFDQVAWPLPVISAVFFYGPVAALVSAEVLALYLVVASRFGVNVNELFAGQGIEGYKGFLRLHIAPDGALTIYPVGLDKVARRWRAAPYAPDHAPWIEPRKPLRPHLIEPPVTLPGPPALARQGATPVRALPTPADPPTPVTG